MLYPTTISALAQIVVRRPTCPVLRTPSTTVAVASTTDMTYENCLEPRCVVNCFADDTWCRLSRNVTNHALADVVVFAKMTW